MGSTRVALFTTNLDIGGAQRVVQNLAKGFAEQGLTVDLVLTRAGEKKYDIPQSVRVVNIGAPRIYAALPGLIKYMRKNRPQAMLSAGSAVNVMVLLAKRLSVISTQLVISEHTTLSKSIENTDDWRKKLLPALMRQTYPWSDAVVAVSEGVATDLSQELIYPEDNIQVIHNPIVTPDLLEKSHEPVEHPWFNCDEPPVVLSAGRFIPAKDYPTLIRAFKQLRNRQSARLVILGKGPNRKELQSLVRKTNIQHDVMFPGFVDNPYKYMRKSDVFVLSSRWEGFGNVLVEAMACGTPVVSTDCPNGPSEILEGGKWGRLVPVGDPDKLSTAIIQTIDDSIDPRPRSKDFRSEGIVESYLSVMNVC